MNTVTGKGKQQGKLNINTTRLLIDLVIFVAFLVAMAPHFSGIAVHEWLSIGLAVGIITHLLLNWSWIVGVTRRFFGKVTWPARVNYLLNVALFVDMTVMIFTGLMISESALPLFGIETTRGGTWRMLHSLSADLFPYLMGLHVALHWQWIVNTSKWLLRRGHHTAAPLTTGTTTGTTTVGESI